MIKVVRIYNCHTPLEEWCLASLLRCILLDPNGLGLFETIWVNIGFVAIWWEWNVGGRNRCRRRVQNGESSDKAVIDKTA